MSTRSEEHDDRELARTEWATFFDALTRRAEADDLEVTIEILGADVGGVEAERLPLAGISYEDGDEAIAVDVGGRGERFPVVLRHFVEDPRRVLVHAEDGQPAAIAIVTSDETTLVRITAS